MWGTMKRPHRQNVKVFSDHLHWLLTAPEKDVKLWFFSNRCKEYEQELKKKDELIAEQSEWIKELESVWSAR